MELEARALLRRKGFHKFRISESNAAEYLQLSAAAEPFLLAFPSSYMVEAGFNHANAAFTKQRTRLNLEERVDLRLKPINFQSSIRKFLESHEAHSLY